MADDWLGAGNTQCFQALELGARSSEFGNSFPSNAERRIPNSDFPIEVP